MKKQKNIQINTNKGNEIMNIKLIQFLCIGLAVFLMSCDVPKRAAALEQKLDDIGDSQATFNKKIDNVQRSLTKKIDGMTKKIDGMEKSIANLKLANNQKPNDKKDQPPKADPNKVYNVSIGDSFVKGPANAAVTIIEWSDFQ